MRCPWLLAQTKVATIFGIFSHLFSDSLGFRFHLQHGTSFGRTAQWYGFGGIVCSVHDVGGTAELGVESDAAGSKDQRSNVVTTCKNWYIFFTLLYYRFRLTISSLLYKILCS